MVAFLSWASWFLFTPLFLPSCLTSGYIFLLIASVPFLTLNQKFLLIWFTLGFIYTPLRGRENIVLCKFPCVTMGNLRSKPFTIIRHFYEKVNVLIILILAEWWEFWDHIRILPRGKKVLNHFYPITSALC